MPNYDYKCPVCNEEAELNVPADERDEQVCDTCYHPLKRVWNFRGSVWAPTAGGMR